MLAGSKTARMIVASINMPAADTDPASGLIPAVCMK
jgi:hypothetical protein